SWLINILTVLYESTLENIVSPNPKDITIYEKVKDRSDYNTIISGFSSDLTMNQLIVICTSNN
ncbi:MAG: hypothetical protein ACI3YK_07605, partial [Eubacteriales bacterium]